MPSWARPAWTLARDTIRGVLGHRVPKLAAEIAFFTLLAFLPAILAIVGTAAFVLGLVDPDVLDRVRREILELTSTFLTSAAQEQIVEPAMDGALERAQPGFIALGFLAGVWATSRAAEAFVEATAIVYGLERRRPGWRRRLMGAAKAVLVLVGGMAVLGLLVVGPAIAGWLASPLGLEETAETAFRITYWPLVAAGGVALLASFYHVATRRPSDWKHQLPGAVGAFLGWLAASLAFRWYAGWSISESSVYRPLAAPIILLMWSYITAIALLVGVELNAQIQKRMGIAPGSRRGSA